MMFILESERFSEYNDKHQMLLWNTHFGMYHRILDIQIGIGKMNFKIQNMDQLTRFPTM